MPFQLKGQSSIYMVSEIAGKDKAQSNDLASGRISDFLRDSHL